MHQYKLFMIHNWQVIEKSQEITLQFRIFGMHLSPTIDNEIRYDILWTVHVLKLSKCCWLNKTYLNYCIVIFQHLPEFYNIQLPEAEEEEWTMVVHNRWQQLYPESQTAAPGICLIWTARNHQLYRGPKKTCWWFCPLD